MRWLCYNGWAKEKRSPWQGALVLPCLLLGWIPHLGEKKKIINVWLTLMNRGTVLGLGTVQVNKTIIFPLHLYLEAGINRSF